MLSENIRKLRAQKGLSQKELGEALNVTQQAIGKWEKGIAEPNSDVLKKLSDIFDISVDYLLGKEDKKSPGDELELDINTLEYALYGEARELDDDEKQQLLELAKLMRKKRQEAEGKK